MKDYGEKEFGLKGLSSVKDSVEMINCAMAIFLLKVNHGMVEKSQTDITTQGEKLPMPILGGLSAK